MAETFKFELVSPERILLSGEAEQAQVPGAEGDFTVLPNHAPVITTLRPGMIRVTLADKGIDDIFVKTGFAEVTPDGLTILTEHAFVTKEADPRMLEDELKAVEEALAGCATDDDEAIAHLNMAIAELKVLHAKKN
ncbi:MAG: ATP synthase F1 subunit epsilon [Hyphomicrobiaceae bacterium]